MIAQAERAFASRQPEEVRRAAQWWSEAAVVEATRVEALIGATRARVWLADRDDDEDSRDRLAREAVESGQWCELGAPDDARCVYWLAVALGVQARERRSTALDALDHIVERLERAIELDPALDRAGPHRVLSLVYLRAPGWPSGPGDPDLGLEQARAAVALEPAFPPNLLALAEAQEAVDEVQESRATYRRAAESARIWAERGEPDADRWLAEALEGATAP